MFCLFFCGGENFFPPRGGGGDRLRVTRRGYWGKIFGPKKDEVTGKWRRLHNEELYDLYCSPNIIRVNNQESWDKRDVKHAVATGELHTEIR